jgi:cell division protein FtsL
MFLRLTVAIVTLAIVALALLTLRQQRFELGHDLVATDRQLDQSRQRLWSLQAQLADRVEPTALHNAATQAQLQLEPLTPLPRPSERVVARLASRPHPH